MRADIFPVSAIHMRDAKAIPVIYDFDGRKIKEFDLDEAYGLILKINFSH